MGECPFDKLDHRGSDSRGCLERFCVPSCPAIHFALLSAWRLRSPPTPPPVLVLLSNRVEERSHGCSLPQSLLCVVIVSCSAIHLDIISLKGGRNARSTVHSGRWRHY